MMLMMAAAKAGKNKQGNDPNRQLLYKHPVPGIPVVETYQQRNPGDVILGYVVDGPLPDSQGGGPLENGPIHQLVKMAKKKASGSSGARTTVQRPLFGPPAATQPGPTGQVVVMGQPYYKEA